MNKVIMIVLDGLQDRVALSSLGYVNHLVEVGKAAYYSVRSELPSLSRPLYEVLLTGTPSSQNGITANHIVRLSKQTSIFHLAAEKGLTTAAAAYFWVSELYNRAPFNPLTDREQHERNLPIQHGKFYFEDTYPDSHLFADAEVLRRSWDPDFLYIHSMNIDDTGHKFGSDSKEYRGKTLMMDGILALMLPIWMEENYHIVITSDHGMNTDGMHGGTGDDERNVPMFVISPNVQPAIYEDRIPQLALASMVCKLLGLKPAAEMIDYTIPGFQHGIHAGE